MKVFCSNQISCLWHSVPVGSELVFATLLFALWEPRAYPLIEDVQTFVFLRHLQWKVFSLQLGLTLG